jgi:methylenetetrahydrofolate reductase (NADPH)
VSRIKGDFGLEADGAPDLRQRTVDDLRLTLDQMRDAGVDNVLALRGDPPKGQERWTKTDGGLEYSSELVEILREDYSFAIGGAAFPETHIHATSPEDDLRFLKAKVDSGCSSSSPRCSSTTRTTSRSSSARGRWASTCRSSRGHADPEPGRHQAMTELSAAELPAGLREQLEARRGNDEAVAELGVAYATLQCADLLRGGAPGIHFITLNRSPATRAILSALQLMQPWR